MYNRRDTTLEVYTNFRIDSFSLKHQRKPNLNLVVQIGLLLSHFDLTQILVIETVGSADLFVFIIKNQ